VPKDGADQIEALPMSHCGGSKTMAQIVNSHVWKASSSPNSLPWLLNPGEVGAASCAREYKLTLPAMFFRNLPQNVQCWLGQGKVLGPCFAVGQPGMSGVRAYETEKGF
jgi:hypothetical protein